MMFTAQACRLLSEWITFLLVAVPPRSRCTFIELLCGCLMSQDGWVTRVISIIARKCHWATYFKLLERGSLKTQALAHQLLRLVLSLCPDGVVTLISRACRIQIRPARRARLIAAVAAIRGSTERTSRAVMCTTI